MKYPYRLGWEGKMACVSFDLAWDALWAFGLPFLKLRIWLKTKTKSRFPPNSGNVIGFSLQLRNQTKEKKGKETWQEIIWKNRTCHLFDFPFAFRSLFFLLIHREKTIIKKDKSNPFFFLWFPPGAKKTQHKCKMNDKSVRDNLFIWFTYKIQKIYFTLVISD